MTRLSKIFPPTIQPGDIWLVPERKLTKGLRIGSVCTAPSKSGRTVRFLVDAVHREQNERYYELVRLGADSVDLAVAERNLSRLASYVRRSGQRFVLAVNGEAAATLAGPPPARSRAIVAAIQSQWAEFASAENLGRRSWPDRSRSPQQIEITAPTDESEPLSGD